MPTVTVDIDSFFSRLGKKLTFKELEELCFDFGIEVEEKDIAGSVSGKNAKAKVKKQYAFEVGANRPDLLCLETLSLSLGVFLGTRKLPVFSVKSAEKKERIIVKPNCKQIRPFVVGCILRNVTLT